MKQHPILFSKPMVQAILDGRKTMTRRIIKPQPIDNTEEDGNFFEGNHKGYVKVDGHPYWRDQFVHEFSKKQVGDILYVRENWKLKAWDFEDCQATFEYADGTRSVQEYFDEKGYEIDGASDWLLTQVDKLENKGITKIVFEDEHDENSEAFIYEFTEKKHPFSPGIHLPKWGSRIWLEITGIRVERLRDITPQEAIAEGIKSFRPVPGDGPAETQYYHYLKDKWGPSPVHSFQTLWESINGPESWSVNPWVWCISFRKIEKP